MWWERCPIQKPAFIFPGSWCGPAIHQPLIMAKHGLQNRQKIFIHTMGVVLKELKECRTALKVIRKKEMIKAVKKLDAIFKETEGLIAIIAKSIDTAKKNNNL